jgi:E3 ubiquitin-protein ligase MARCH6
MANIADGEREAAVQLIANNRPNQQDENHHPEERVLLHIEDEQREPGTHEHGDAFDHDDEELPHSPAELDSAWDTSVRDDNLSFLDGTPADEFNAPSSFRRNVENDDDKSSNHLIAPQGWGNETFRDLWMRGHGDPEKVLRIIHEEGRQDELGWVVEVATKVQQLNQGSARLASSVSRGDENEPTEDAIGASTGPSPSDFYSTAASLPSSPIGQPWDIASPHSRNDVGTVHSRNAFTFDFPEPGLESAGDRELQLNAQGSKNGSAQVNQESDFPDPSSTHSISNVVGEPVGNIAPSTQVDHHTAIPPRNLATRLFDWFWADITPDDQAREHPLPDEEHVVEDPALEAPFVPLHNNRRLPDEGVQDNQGMLADAGLDGNDIDAVEDGDDLEGILELIGMQGPIFGLLQNGVFSALLISFTVSIGIWLPYLWGKIALVLLANPIQLVVGVPMTAVSVFADITLDTLIGILGYMMYGASLIFKLFLSPLSTLFPLGDWILRTKSITSAALSLIDASSHRLGNVISTFLVFHESDVPMFSVLSHQALKIHEERITSLIRLLFGVGHFVLYDLPIRLLAAGVPNAQSLKCGIADINEKLSQARGPLYEFGNQLLFSSNSSKWFNASVSGLASGAMTVDYELAVWDTKDRVIAIVMGYLLASVLGLLYLRITGLMSGADRGQRVEGIVADILHQAGGVLKVILIIGIEMIVFPLYCGTLLDIALLPLFDNATIASRLAFTSSSPLTSLFVHWFIGTCYMFHFALFVSMCRKVMRSGVLCKLHLSALYTHANDTDFIRDPDDPTFHPVRDVLERNIATQLRKIAFSALVYGTLVIICLGGVVWGLYYAFDGVLPVHWSATMPVLEFPVDLLFYNFIMPLVIRSIKPSDGLHSLYNWWFHKCARLLRLTNFFFGERQPDEEGRHVRRTWWATLSWAKGDIDHPVIGEEQRYVANDKHIDAYFVRDGKFVRAPASDQVRIPKGNSVFLEVSESNERVDGAPDTNEGLHGRTNAMFTKVYIPPFFRTRIAVFILLIWVFAAATGVGITIIPLVAGRKMMSSYFSNRPVNDIYAFSAGICIVGSAAYLVVYCHTSFSAVKDRLRPYLQSPRQACLGLTSAMANSLRLIYIALAFSVFLPSLFALVIELYLLVPVHTYLDGAQAHVIHFVQDWTIGVLYVQMAIKFVLWHSTSRPAAALNGIFRDGWLKPNVKLATRALLFPVIFLTAIAVALPLSGGFLVNSTVFYLNPEVHPKVYRYAYPLTLSVSLLLWLGFLAHRQVEIWRVNIRDDVYLIGERLHNFREKRVKDVGVSRRVITG